MKKRRILVTCALTYANGPLHLGHMVEYIQADIWVRFLRMMGHECYFVGGDDAHGTPVMLSAQKLGVEPKELISKVNQEHKTDLAGFLVNHDIYYTTHSDENRALTEHLYQQLQANDDITKRSIKQAYDPVKEMFLPDRFVKGDCPRCKAKDQYGDNCEVCGATYSPTDLIDPVSALSGATPIQKESEHYFFRLDHYQEMLQKWFQSGTVQPAVANKLNEWFTDGLKEWDISRDKPYFGFEIPGAPGKYFYVWLDAPIGYMAAFKKLCDARKDLVFDDFWKENNDTELYHFVGKDILYFHALFWPATLTSAGYRKPSSLFVHGFLTINGSKMSKSRGTFIRADDYLDHLNPEYLRYYFAAKLTNRVSDIDMSFDDFMFRVNSDLVGKVVNIASRCAGFITKKYDGMLSSNLAEPELIETFIKAGDEIAEHYESLIYSHAVREIMALADKANQYIDEKKPWALSKEAGNESAVHDICSMGIHLFRIIMIYLKPILPNMAKDVEAFLAVPEMQWDERSETLLDHKINKFKPLMQRIEKETLEKL